MKPCLYILKTGGKVLDDEDAMLKFTHSLARLEQPCIVVHGGGLIATEVGNRLGIESKYNEGRRITDRETIDLVTMVYGGLLNKQLVARLQKEGLNAIGLSGADGNLLRAVKRPAGEVDYGYVGDVDVEGVNVGLLLTLLMDGYLPVICALTHDGAGQMLNTNADTIAQVLAAALVRHYRVRLVFAFDKPGVLLDADDETSRIPEINRETYNRLKAEKRVSAGILPKISNALEAVDNGVEQVYLGPATELDYILAGTTGTIIREHERRGKQ